METLLSPFVLEELEMRSGRFQVLLVPLAHPGTRPICPGPPHKLLPRLPPRSAWAWGHTWDIQVLGGYLHVKIGFKVIKWPKEQGCMAENVQACIREGSQRRPWILEASTDTASPRWHAEGRVAVKESCAKERHM